jgi:5'-3' exonuclease
LKGDPSDNIPGVKGIGEKTAMEILQKYQSLDNLYENIDKYLNDSSYSKDKKLLNILKENEDEARFSKHLAMIKKDVIIDVKLDQTKFDFNNKDEVVKFFRTKGFNSLIPKLNLTDLEKVKNNKNTKNEIKIKQYEEIKLFINDFDKSKGKMFVFDNQYLNINEKGLFCFYKKEDMWYTYQEKDKISPIMFDGIKPFTYDSKSLYHKYFDSFNGVVFYDFKIAF